MTEISPEQAEISKLPPALITLFSDEKMPLQIPGRESLFHLHGQDKEYYREGY